MFLQKKKRLCLGTPLKMPHGLYFPTWAPSYTVLKAIARTGEYKTKVVGRMSIVLPLSLLSSCNLQGLRHIAFITARHAFHRRRLSSDR